MVIKPTRLSTLPAQWAQWDDPIFNRTAAAALLAQPGHALWAYAHGGHVLARIISGEAADILTVHVPPALRQQGYGRSLIKHVLEAAQGAGCPRVVLEVRADNTAALALYASLGFSQIHRRPRYYGTTDALVLACEL
jgi:[ribosomal protein S18]-alanine N-acetyltransferase